jgi:hypothetical protein
MGKLYKKGGEINPDNKGIKNYFAHGSGKAGGVLVGKRHSEGGIKALNKSTGQPLEMEGGEVVITRNAVSDNTKREFNGQMLTNREILSKINESGGGVSFAKGGDVPKTIYTSGKEYKYGGKTMKDHDIVSSCGCKNSMAKGGETKKYPKNFKTKNNKGINPKYNYALLLINKNKDVYLMGSFSKLETAESQKNFWEKNYSDKEEVDRFVIDELVIDKMAKGGLAKTPAPKKDRIIGSKKNKPGSAASKASAKSITLNDQIVKVLKNKVEKYKKDHPSSKLNVNTLKAVMRRGMGAYSSSHRPTISGGAPNSRTAWGFARVNAFLKKKSGAKVKAAYVQDDDLLKSGGRIVWHDSDAPDANGKFKELNIKELAAWLIKTRNKDVKKISASINQQIVFNRKKDPKYASKMEKVRTEVYKQLGREDLLANGGDLDQEITCVNCGWHWNTKDSDESDKYICHKCGFDNRTYYDSDPVGKIEKQIALPDTYTTYDNLKPLLEKQGYEIYKSIKPIREANEIIERINYLESQNKMGDVGVTKFYKEYLDWYKNGVSDKMTIMISIPNSFSKMSSGDNDVILDVFEKTDESVNGKEKLKELLQLADKNKIDVYLEPIPRHNKIKDEAKKEKITRQYLISYYKMFGFELLPNGFMVRKYNQMKTGGDLRNSPDFLKGKKEELEEHRDTFEKLRKNKLTADQAAELVVLEHLKKKPDYYKKYSTGGKIQIEDKKIISYKEFLDLDQRVKSPYDNENNYYYPLYCSKNRMIMFFKDGNRRNNCITPQLAYKSFLFHRYKLDFKDLSAKEKNALMLGKQSLLENN